MTDIVERIDTALFDDHERGCPIRFAGCECGFDDATLATLTDAKTEIATVRAERDALRALAHQSSQAFDVYVQNVNDTDPSEIEAAYSMAFASLRDKLNKALGDDHAG